MVCLIWVKGLVSWRINREANWWTEQVWFWWNSKYNKVIVFLGLEVWQLINSPEVTSGMNAPSLSVTRAQCPRAPCLQICWAHCMSWCHALLRDIEERQSCTNMHRFIFSYFGFVDWNFQGSFVSYSPSHPLQFFPYQTCYLVMVLPYFGGVTPIDFLYFMCHKRTVKSWN